MTSTVLLIALGCLFGGIVIGLLLTRALHPEEKKRKALQEELEKTRQELKDYQHDVTSHFMQTSNHINNLTQNYRELHEHLSHGAMRLASPEISRQMIDAGYGKLTDDSAIDPSLAPSPPKDYAPKVPGGVLSEDYGLREDDADIHNHKDRPSIEGSAEEDDSDPTLKVG